MPDPLENENNINLPLSERRIYTNMVYPEVESLHGKYQRGKLILQSDFQRHFIWDVKKSSRLIESALLDIPLPVIYLSQEKDGREIVIDGQQRLNAFFSFIDGKFPSGQPFRLSGLKVFNELNKKSYKELNEQLQDKVRYCKLGTITFSKDSNIDLKFEIFERLNSGAVSLNAQELRNCIYRGPFNELLKMLAKNEDFISLVGKEPQRDRMRNVEYVLRFAAFYHSTYLQYKPTMRHFLNNEMERFKNIDELKAFEFENAFKKTVSINKSLWGEHAFKRFYPGIEKNRNGYWTNLFNASLYDILMYSFANEDKNKVYQHLEAIRESLICLMTENEDFIDAIELGTSGLQAVRTRFDIWRMTLQEILGLQIKEPRCFSSKLKEELYHSDPYCSICGQKIQLIDDASVDHIQQYWVGGKTIPENARLTHRYCNSARSKNDLPERFSGLAKKLKGHNKNRKYGNSTTPSNPLSFKKPRAFVFEGIRYPVSQWKELLITLCTIIYNKRQTEFGQLLKLHGSKRRYISNDPSDMDIPERIGDSKFYVETKWSGSGTINLCKQIIETLGYRKTDLEIEI